MKYCYKIVILGHPMTTIELERTDMLSVDKILRDGFNISYEKGRIYYPGNMIHSIQYWTEK